MTLALRFFDSSFLGWADAGCKFKNTTRRGPFGDALVEVDWIIGSVVDSLEQHDIDKNTLSVPNAPFFLSSASPLLCELRVRKRSKALFVILCFWESLFRLFASLACGRRDYRAARPFSVGALFSLRARIATPGVCWGLITFGRARLGLFRACYLLGHTSPNSSPKYARILGSIGLLSFLLVCTRPDRRGALCCAAGSCSRATTGRG